MIAVFILNTFYPKLHSLVDMHSLVRYLSDDMKSRNDEITGSLKTPTEIHATLTNPL